MTVANSKATPLAMTPSFFRLPSRRHIPLYCFDPQSSRPPEYFRHCQRRECHYGISAMRGGDCNVSLIAVYIPSILYHFRRCIISSIITVASNKTVMNSWIVRMYHRRKPDVRIVSTYMIRRRTAEDLTMTPFNNIQEIAKSRR